MAYQKIGIVGGGAWGTGLAQAVRQAGRDVRLWAREFETVAAINETHQNPGFLPGIALDPAIRATSNLAEIAASDVILMVAPAQHTRAVAAELSALLPDERPVVLCCKGIEQTTDKLISQVVAEVMPQAVTAVLSGPSFAEEVARGLPTALTLACADEGLGVELCHALGHPAFRLYWGDDLIGVQVGGAIKNVLAIAAGIVRGKQLGSNAHAALTTRGFGEMVRCGAALGARPETLAGLSGLGDLLLTCGSAQSRNLSLGIALGEGRKLDDLLGARASVVEGVYTASAVMDIAREHGLDLPICAAVQAIVSGSISVDEAIESLLARPFRAER